MAFGFSQTSSDVDEITDIIERVINNTTQDCAVQSDVLNNFYLGDDADAVICKGIRQHGVAAIASICYQDAANRNKLTDEIKKAIESYAETKGAPGLVLGVGNTSVDVDVSTEIEKTINNITSQPCDSVANITNQITVLGRLQIIPDPSTGECFGFEQIGNVEIDSECKQISRSINELANKVDTAIKASATTTGPLSMLLDPTTLMMIAGIILLVILAYFLVQGGGQKQQPYHPPPSQYPPPQYPPY